MQSVHHPLAGDSIYGLSKGGVRVHRLMLHAHTLDFTHPRTGERLHFAAEPPKDYLAAVDRLRVKKG
jgi:23S rRNA pseudouridine1911/1915/1917 synthase